jgi:putative transposase
MSARPGMDKEKAGLPVRKRPPRMACFDYLGPCRYFVTLCTAAKRPVFVRGFDYATIVTILSRLAGYFGVDVLTYCFMPDHLHFLLEGTEKTDLKEFIRVFKQMTSYYSNNDNGILWQRSYYDRILRRDEDSVTVAQYILNNPVRRGLAETATDYPYSGSFVAPLKDIL